MPNSESTNPKGSASKATDSKASDPKVTIGISQLLQLQTAVAHGIPRPSITPQQPSTGSIPSGSSGSPISGSSSSDAIISPVFGVRCPKCHRATSSDPIAAETATCPWCSAGLSGWKAAV